MYFHFWQIVANYFSFLKNIANTTKKKCGAILFSITKKHPITNGMDQKMLTIDLRIAILYFKPLVKWSHWRLSISPNCYIFVVKFSTCSLLISFVYCVQELTNLFFKVIFFWPNGCLCNGLSPTCLGVLLYSHLMLQTLTLGSQPKIKHEKEVGWKNVLKFKRNPTRLQEWVLTLSSGLSHYGS